MYLKMWLRRTIVLALLLLLSPTLSACDLFQSNTITISPSTEPTKAEISCILDIGMYIVQNVRVKFEDDRLVLDVQSGEDDGSASADCFQAAVDLISQIKITNNQQQEPQVVYKQHVDSTFPYTFTSSILSNCTDAPASGIYSYNLPLILNIGTLDSSNKLQPLETFVEPLPSIPTSPDYTLFPSKGGDFVANSDSELLAKQLYSDNDFPDNYFNQPGQSSDSFPLKIPANKKVQLNLPLTISYRAGDGEVIRNGQAGQGMQWMYVYTFQRDFDPNNLTAQMTVTPC